MIKEEVEKFVQDALAGGDFDVNEISLEHPENELEGGQTPLRVGIFAA